MQKSNWLALITLAAAAWLGGGCQDTVNTMDNADRQMAPQSLDTRRFISDSFCRDRLTLLAMNRAQTPGGMMMVQATLRSERYGFWSELWSWITDENPYHVAYKFEWFDANGMRINSATGAWQTEIFIPGETKYLQGVAPNDKCRDFSLSVKEATVEQ